MNHQKHRLRPYRNWDKEELKDMLIKHLYILSVDPRLERLWINLIIESFKSDKWSPINDYNGCTMVQDELHPSLACFPHDYMWISGHGGRVADRIFYNLMIHQGMKKSKAYRRWIGVRFGWFFYFKWKYVLLRKLNEPTDAMKELDSYFRK